MCNFILQLFSHRQIILNQREVLSRKVKAFLNEFGENCRVYYPIFCEVDLHNDGGWAL